MAAVLIVALLGSSLMLAVGGGQTATPAPTSAPLAAANASGTLAPSMTPGDNWTIDPNHSYGPYAPDDTQAPDASPTVGVGYKISDNVSAKLMFECDQSFLGANLPVFSGGLVYIDCATQTSSVVRFAFDGSTGAIKHRYETDLRGQLYVDNGLWYSPDGNCDPRACATPWTVYRLDPNTGQVTFSLKDAMIIAGKPGWIWAALKDQTMVRIDTTTLAVTPARLNEWTQACGRLWGQNAALELNSTDPATGKLIATYKIPDAYISSGVHQTPQGCWTVADRSSGAMGSDPEQWFVKLGDSGIQA